MYRSPDHRRVKTTTPRVIGSDDRILLFETSDVLTTGIDAPMAEETGHLCAQLLIALVAIVP